MVQARRRSKGVTFLPRSAEHRPATEAAGFYYKLDEKTTQFIHSSGIMIATPDGRPCAVLLRDRVCPEDLRLGLIEASDARLGMQWINFCCTAITTTPRRVSTD